MNEQKLTLDWERSYAEADIQTCPWCQSRSALSLRSFVSETGRESMIAVGCSTCNRWATELESSWAVAEWNDSAIREWQQLGMEIEHAELQQLFLEKTRLQRRMVQTDDAIRRYVEQRVVPNCPFRPGDLFQTSQRPAGVWYVERIEGRYGWNTGPFWVVHAVNVLPSGILGEKSAEFWQPDGESMRALRPFWRPSRWSQVVVGDACLIGDQEAVIESVDVRARSIRLRTSEEATTVIGLNSLLVPLARVQA
jgi:hypothetical protein